MTRRRLLTSAALLTIVCSAAPAQQGYEIRNTVFLPPQFYVGDVVEVRMRIVVDGQTNLWEPEELPAPSWVTIHGVRIFPVAGEYDVRITFSSFRPGTRSLPPIDLGGLTLSDIRITTGSVVGDEGSALADVADAVLLPGSTLLLALAIGIVLLGPLGVFASVRWIRRSVRSIVERRHARLPMKELLGALDAVRGADAKADARELYFAIMAAFRGYLSRKTELNLSAFTADELIAFLEERLPLLPQMRRIPKFMKAVDAVRFGGKRVGRSHRAKDIDFVIETAQSLERSQADAED